MMVFSCMGSAELDVHEQTGEIVSAKLHEKNVIA